MQKWEYCGIDGSTVIYMPPDNIECVKQKVGKQRESPAREEVRMIAQLGLDGWEMVGGPEWGWFKRPLQEVT